MNQILLSGICAAVSAGSVVLMLYLIHDACVESDHPGFADVKAAPVVDAARIMPLILARSLVQP